MKIFPTLFLSLILAISLSCTRDDSYAIVLSDTAGKEEKLAAGELRRYLYQTSGRLADIIVEDQCSGSYLRWTQSRRY